MFSSLQSDKCKTVEEFLKLSLIPVACQESQLKADGCTQAESMEWLLDLKNNIPIWSRLWDINTSGFKRKLPMSMTKNYDIEVEERLWSLWGSKRRHTNRHKLSKSYMAITVMALCAARVMSLNGWNSNLMDVIRKNGHLFFKENISKGQCRHKHFQLQHLLNDCSLEGIQFSLHLKTVQNGLLYSSPLGCQANLSSALIHFFEHYQYGILECGNRILGFGVQGGPQGGYFMYDAQNCNALVLPQNTSAPYLLRTNHIQVLLYCLVVALNVRHMQVAFCLHHVEIIIESSYDKSLSKSLSNHDASHPRIMPSDLCWKTSEAQLKRSESSTNTIEYQKANTENETQHETRSLQKKYRRKIHNIRKEKVQQSLIKPLVDADHESEEDVHLKQDFVRMICSDTVLPLTRADMPQNSHKEFSCNLVDALFMGPEACLMFKDL